MDLQDPFYVLQTDVQSALTGLTLIYDKWRALLSSKNSSPEEIEFTENEVTQAIKHIETNLSFIEETISKVEVDKQRFNFDDEEIQKRKQFVQTTRDQLKKIRNGVDSVKVKHQENKRKTKTKGGYTQLQQEKIRQGKEEQELQELGYTVNNLEQISLQIHSELDTHNQILTEMGEDIHHTGNKMKYAMNSLDKLLDSTPERTQWCIVIFLIIILIGLLFLAIYI